MRLCLACGRSQVRFLLHYFHSQVSHSVHFFLQQVASFQSRCKCRILSSNLYTSLMHFVCCCPGSQILAEDVSVSGVLMPRQPLIPAPSCLITCSLSLSLVKWVWYPACPVGTAMIGFENHLPRRGHSLLSREVFVGGMLFAF